MRKLLILFFVLVLTGCVRENTTVPLIIYNMEDEYIADFQSKIVENAENVVDIITYDSQNSQVIQNEFIERLIEESPLLIVNPVDRLSAYNIIEKAKSTNTPIIFINREPLITDMLKGDNIYYIGANPIGSAVLQAEIVMDLFGGDPLELNENDSNGDNIIQAVILKGQIGHQDAELRTQYVVSEIEENGYGLEILEIRVANFDMLTAQNEMKLLLEDYGDQIEVVIANNDAMAIGAINTLIEEEYFVDENSNDIIDRDTEAWLPVIGLDGLKNAIELIHSGYLYGTVINDSQSMAEAIISLSNIIINNQSLDSIEFEITNEKYIWIAYQKYTWIDFEKHKNDNINIQ
jgi:methyl-galactoside transport system substrate-binding protein